MSEPKLISPLLDSFIMGDPMSDHGGVKACPAMKKDSEDKYIVKIISIPASPSQLDALLLSGAYPDRDGALAYYKGIATGIVEEAKILQRLADLEGFYCYEDQQIEPMEEESGFDVYLLSPYRKSLSRHFSKNTMTHLGALNLGLDLCAALSVARQSGYLYVALKPENVYMTQDQGYRIGDIGFLKLDTLKYASLPERYRSAYTAPEIEDAYSSLNTTIDVYAAGLILYQAFNGGVLPRTDEPLPPPDYADYEISEIILKACAQDPAQRWQNPIEMGQAIVAYMQRNGAHDVPIVPPAPESEEEPADTEEENAPSEAIETAVEEAEVESDCDICTEPSDDEQTEATDEQDESQQDAADQGEEVPGDSSGEADSCIFKDDGLGNISFLDEISGDETLPGEDSADVDYDQISVEVSDILTQVDDLIAHPTPDPVVPPEPVEVNLPPVDIPTAQEEDEEITLTPLDARQANPDSECDSAEADTEPPADEPETEEAVAEDITADEENEVSEEDNLAVKPKRHWLRNSMIVLLVLALLAAGFFFYKYFYLQLIDSIRLEGNEDKLTVYVDSEIDNSLLSVVCTDTYGIQTVQPVVDGKAIFTGLAPDSAYRVQLTIKGFHKLQGDTSTAYTTPVRTDIVQFGAVTGTEDGSAVIGFAIEGPDVDQWKLTYGATGEEAKEVLFSGHMYTLTGLTIGTEYSFELLPAEDVYVTGINTVTHVAKKIVRAENLTVNACLDGKLEASWTVAEGSEINSWTVHCYNDGGFDKTVVTETNSVVVEGITDTDGYTLEVTAAGMSVSERTQIEKNSVTVTDFKAEQKENGSIAISWGNCNAVSGTALTVCYQVDGSPVQRITVEGANSTALLDPVPGATYTFSMQTESGAAVFGASAQVTTKQASAFNAYKVTASRIRMQMCKTPAKKNWDRHDLSGSDYTTSFRSGEKASFLMRVSGQYGISSDQVNIQFVIRDRDNHVVSAATQTQKWSSMWHRNYGEFNIPELPSSPGSYTVFVYFNGGLVGQQSFTVNS